MSRRVNESVPTIRPVEMRFVQAARLVPMHQTALFARLRLPLGAPCAPMHSLLALILAWRPTRDHGPLYLNGHEFRVPAAHDLQVDRTPLEFVARILRPRREEKSHLYRGDDEKLRRKRVFALARAFITFECDSRESRFEDESGIAPTTTSSMSL